MHVIIRLKMRNFIKKIIAKSLSAKEIHSQILLPPEVVGLVIGPLAAEPLTLCQICSKKKICPSLSLLRFFLLAPM